MTRSGTRWFVVPLVFVFVFDSDSDSDSDFGLSSVLIKKKILLCSSVSLLFLFSSFQHYPLFPPKQVQIYLFFQFRKTLCNLAGKCRGKERKGWLRLENPPRTTKTRIRRNPPLALLALVSRSVSFSISSPPPPFSP